MHNSHPFKKTYRYRVLLVAVMLLAAAFKGSNHTQMAAICAPPMALECASFKPTSAEFNTTYDAPRWSYQDGATYYPFAVYWCSYPIYEANNPLEATQCVEFAVSGLGGSAIPVTSDALPGEAVPFNAFSLMTEYSIIPSCAYQVDEAVCRGDSAAFVNMVGVAIFDRPDRTERANNLLQSDVALAFSSAEFAVLSQEMSQPCGIVVSSDFPLCANGGSEQVSSAITNYSELIGRSGPLVDIKISSGPVVNADTNVALAILGGENSLVHAVQTGCIGSNQLVPKGTQMGSCTVSMYETTTTKLLFDGQPSVRNVAGLTCFETTGSGNASGCTAGVKLNHKETLAYANHTTSIANIDQRTRSPDNGKAGD